MPFKKQGIPREIWGICWECKKTAQKQYRVPVTVNYEKPDVYHMSSEAQGIIHVVNVDMEDFLRTFGIEEKMDYQPSAWILIQKMNSRIK